MIWAGIQKAVDFTVKIIQISEVHASRRADRHASRVEPLFYPVDAECAFVCISIRMDEPRVVRT